MLFRASYVIPKINIWSYLPVLNSAKSHPPKLSHSHLPMSHYSKIHPPMSHSHTQTTCNRGAYTFFVSSTYFHQPVPIPHNPIPHIPHAPIPHTLYSIMVLFSYVLRSASSGKSSTTSTTSDFTSCEGEEGKREGERIERRR